MKPAIIYRRASTNEETQTNSLGNQEAELYEFAARNGYNIEADIAEYQSAYKNKERKGFEKALGLLRKNKELTLIVHDLTRLSRDIGNWNMWAPLLGQIRFANMGDKSMTELEASLLLVVSANESRVLSERTKKGIQRARERAQEAGSVWSWGGNTNPTKAREVNKAKTANWRQTIQNVCNNLDPKNVLSLREKAEWLNDNGFTNQRGRPISTQTLHNALKAA